MKLISICCIKGCGIILPDGDRLSEDDQKCLRKIGVQFSHGYCKTHFIETMVESCGHTFAESEAIYYKLQGQK